MGLFDSLKLLHMSCAFISIGGFALRGYWKITENPLCAARPVRVLPHLVDTLLLASAVAMLLVWELSPLALPWVSAKIVALLVYIGLGMAVMRFAATRRGRLVAYCLALLCAAYIIAVAYTKSVLGPLALAG